MVRSNESNSSSNTDPTPTTDEADPTELDDDGTVIAALVVDVVLVELVVVDRRTAGARATAGTLPPVRGPTVPDDDSTRRPKSEAGLAVVAVPGDAAELGGFDASDDAGSTPPEVEVTTTVVSPVSGTISARPEPP